MGTASGSAATNKLKAAPTIQHDVKLIEGIRLDARDPSKRPFERHYGEQNE